MSDSDAPRAPDLTLGVAVDSLSSGGSLLGRVGDDDVLLARAGERFFAVGAIVGGGAAGLAAADMLRREGYDGPIVLVSADEDPPVDRPNLSKDYLAGEAQDDWIPMWPADVYAERHIELLLGSRVSSIDPGGRTVLLENGSRRDFGALLIATGADPVRLPIPGADGTQVCYLRSFADSRAIVERARTAKHVVVVGASFIGLEVSAALRTRGVAVDVVAPDQVPLERVMGTEVGRFVQ